MTVVNQQRIAKNTFLLYVRMVVVMLVGLYTTRVVIDALGLEHYGVYDAVGGIVLMVSFISSTMSGACQRYYSYEIGRQNTERLKLVFSISLTVFFILTAFILILAETLGIWYLNNHADDGGHTTAARWVYQFSVLAFIISILKSPYQGMVVAKEKMKVFAYLSLFECFASLATAMILSHTPDIKDNRLILYGGLMAGIQLVTSSFYWIYCRLFYAECRLTFRMDKAVFKEMFAYAGWNMIGSCSDVFERVGLNMLLNVKFGPIVSGARGIANKVFNTMTQLNTNFFMAVKPQIYKSHAAGEKKELHKLVCLATRISFFLVILVALPILLETDFILKIWLRGRNITDLAVLLTKLMVIEGLVNCFTEPLATAVQATGDIRNYKVVIGGTFLLILPLSYLGITFAGLPPESAFIISIIVSFITQVERLWFVKKQVQLNMSYYFRTVLIPVAIVAVICISLSILFKSRIDQIEFDRFWVGPVLVIAVSMLTVCLSFYIFGITKSERRQAWDMAMNLIGKNETGNKNAD